MKNNKFITLSRSLTIFLCAVIILTFSVGVFTLNATAQRGSYDNLKLIPGGMPFGVKFDTQGVIVIGFCDVDSGGQSQNPAYESGIRIKDVITQVNGEHLRDANQFTSIVENSQGSLDITYLRNGVEKTVDLNPAYSKSESRYKTGVWVRDSGAGIGTVTYINPQSGYFAGLGHGICDPDTGELIAMSGGVITNVKINGVKKGVCGTPGELKGMFDATKTGELLSNTNCGMYGKLKVLPQEHLETLPVALKEEIRSGSAYLYCTLDETGIQKYDIEISAINRDACGSKCFTVVIKDPKLIEKTGGIVQGMSGSPIIQNGCGRA